MSRTSPLSALVLLCAVVVCLSTAGAIAPVLGSAASASDTASGETTTVSNTTNYLSPSEDFSRQSYTRANVDVAGAVAFSSEQLHSRHSSLDFSQRYSAQSDSSGKLEVAEQTVDTAATRLSRLDARHETLMAAYANGSVSSETFLRRLGRIQVSATETRELLQRVRTRVQSDSDTSLPVTLDTRLASLRAELVALPSPITSRVSDSLIGTADSMTVYAAGTSEGLVLATAGDQYTRQATLRSEYAPGEPSQFVQSDQEPISIAFDRARSLYPWVFNNLQSINRIGGFGNSDVYFFDVSHPHGDLQSYIHGASTNVFREHHVQQPESPPVRLTARNETTAVQLAVNATAETGPMHVSVTRGTTSVPADATIRVNGQVVGSTGDDGEMWTVRPAGLLRVNATVDTDSVVVRRP